MKLLLSLLVSVVSLEAFAGYIVPNIRRDNITINQGGSAIGLSRKMDNATLSYGTEEGKNSYKDDVYDDDTKNEDSRIIGSYAIGDSVKTELYIQNSKYHREDDNSTYDYEANLYFGNISYKAMDGLYLGAQIYNVDYKTDQGIDSNELKFSGTYNLAGPHYLGGGVGQRTVDGWEITQTETYFGYGLLNENLSVEGVAISKTADKDDDSGYSVGSSIELVGTVNWVKNDWDILASLSYEVEDDKETELETKDLYLGASPEYKINEMFYGGISIQIMNRSLFNDRFDSGSEINRTTVGAYARVKWSQFQAVALLSSETGKYDFDDGDDSDYDISENAVDVYFTYFF